MKPHRRVQLGPRVYYVDKEVQLPEGAELRGAGVNKTRIVSCGAPSSGRRTLVLGNNTYLGHFTFQGLQAKRGNFEGAVGTPGCLATDCAATGRRPACIPADGNCAGVQNATAEYIHVSTAASFLALIHV